MNYRFPWSVGLSHVEDFAKRIGLNAVWIAVAVVSGCGGGEGNSDTATPVTPPPSTINGVTVPPDPGQAANTTVAGIDTDNNGIRDEIDRFIATKYGSSEQRLKAARTAAKAMQRTLTVDASSQSAAVDAIAASGDAAICAARDFRASGASSTRELDEILARTVNTPSRITQRQALAVSAGVFTRSVIAVRCP